MKTGSELVKKLWLSLNAPLPVGIICILLIAGLIGIGMLWLGRNLREDDERRDEIEALGRLQVLSFAKAGGTGAGPHKYVGKMRNNSRFIVYNVQAAVCAYDANDKLQDVTDCTVQGIGRLAPGQEREFYVERHFRDDEEGWGGDEPLKIEGEKVTINLVATDTAEVKDD